MPNAYHHVFFTLRDGISDDEVIERFRRFRDLAVGKGYIKSADDFSVGKVVIPAGGDDEVARIRQMTGGFTWAETVHEKSRWVPHSLLWGGKRAARRAATISVWPTKQVLMPFMT